MQYGCLDPQFDVLDRVAAMLDQSAGVKDGFAVFSSFYGLLGESFVFEELIDERHFICHGRLSQLECLLNTLLCSKEESLRKVARVGT